MIKRSVVWLAGLGLLLGHAGVAVGQGIADASYHVVDAQRKRLYGYDDLGVPSGSADLDAANANPGGVGGDGVSIYVVDRVKKRVFRYDPDGTFDAASRVLRGADGASLSNPGGVSIEGESLWVVDRGRARIFAYSLDDAFSSGAGLRAIEEIALVPENTRAEGLAVDPAWLYVLDETDKQVYRYFRDGLGPVEVSRVMRLPNGGSLGAPSGLTTDGDVLVLVDRSRDQMLLYDRLDLFATGPALRAFDESPLDPQNGDARGLQGPFEGRIFVGSTDLSWVEQELLKLVTAHRTANGLPPLQLDPMLMDAAGAHNERMAVAGNLVHQLPGEPALAQRVADSGYQATAAGETIAQALSPQQVFAAWKASPLHNPIMLGNFKHVGLVSNQIGTQRYWTMVVARP